MQYFEYYPEVYAQIGVRHLAKRKKNFSSTSDYYRFILLKENLNFTRKEITQTHCKDQLKVLHKNRLN